MDARTQSGSVLHEREPPRVSLAPAEFSADAEGLTPDASSNRVAPNQPPFIMYRARAFRTHRLNIS